MGHSHLKKHKRQFLAGLTGAKTAAGEFEVFYLYFYLNKERIPFYYYYFGSSFSHSICTQSVVSNLL